MQKELKAIEPGLALPESTTTTKEKPTGDGNPTAGDTINDLDFPITERIDKRETTLIATLALMGHAVHKLADGGFLIARWGMTRYCADACQLAGFLAQLEGRL